MAKISPKANPDVVKNMSPQISIVLICYNQEDYIEKALDSILAQKGIDNCEIIIGDDSSTDKTVDIIGKISQESGKKIHLIERPENLGPSENLYDVLSRCKGDFIAILEGDDYWSDEFKLKKQLEFLKKNQEYIGCVHRYSVVDSKDRKVHPEYRGKASPAPGGYSIREFSRNIHLGLLGTFFFRNFFKVSSHDLSILKRAHFYIADLTLTLLMVLHGSVFVMDDNMACSRTIIKKNGTNYKSKIFKKNQIAVRLSFLEKLENYSKKEFDTIIIFKKNRFHDICWSILFLLRYSSVWNFQQLIKVLFFSFKFPR